MSTITMRIAAREAEKTLLGGLQTAFRAFQIRRARQAASLTLAAMDDHMLKDIGISRSEIDSAVCGLQPGGRRGHGRTAN
jgi:uncharacterized protein YjiS (DUF1127 family)